MIAEIIPEAYDALGTQVSQPFSRRKGPHPTFPMGRYVCRPLGIRCKTMADIRNFLLGCRYISDQELFGKRDYWQPPEDFEKNKEGRLGRLRPLDVEATVEHGIRRTVRPGICWSLRRWARLGRILPRWQVLLARATCLQGRIYPPPTIDAAIRTPNLGFLGWKDAQIFFAQETNVWRSLANTCVVSARVSRLLGLGRTYGPRSSSADRVANSPKRSLQTRALVAAKETRALTDLPQL